MFLICSVTNPPCLNPYNMVNYGVSQLLTNVIKHMGITTTLAKCVTRCKHSICSLWHFLLCIFTTHPPPPSSLFYSTEIKFFFQKLGSGVAYYPLSYIAWQGEIMAKFFFTGEPTQGQKSQKSQKSHENIGNPQYFQRHFHFLQFGPNQALYGITSMSHSYNRVNYGVSQLLTNVIKHKGITTTLASCVTRCKHHFCSLCPCFWSAVLPTLHVSTHTTWSIMVSHNFWPMSSNIRE